jgi:hypothetical protein
MVFHVNPFADIGSPGGVAKDVYKHWNDKGARLATYRKRCETWACIFFVVALAASNFNVTKDYAVLGFLFGGMLVYRAIMCRFEENTIEGVLHKWDLDCVIELLIEQRKEASENRMHEMRRPATDMELMRRGDIIRGMENVLKRTD